MNRLVPEKFKPLVEKVVGQFQPGGKYEVLKDVRGGKSGAIVLLLDLAGGPEPTNRAKGGQFILKLEEQRQTESGDRNEAQRHLSATLQNLDFAAKHIPKLVASAEEAGRVVLLYEVAARGMSSFVTADTVDFGPLKHHCVQVGRALLEDLNPNYEVKQGISLNEAMVELLGPLLDNQKSPELHEFVGLQTSNQPVFVLAGRLLVNPLWLCEVALFANVKSSSFLTGFLHGDLNLTNLLIDRQHQVGDGYWLIDFASSHSGLLSFDHAYLELALLRRHFREIGEDRLLRSLRALDAAPGTPQAEEVPIEDSGLLECLRSLRLSMREWMVQKESNREDQFTAQQLLARVAASINRMAKAQLPTEERRLILAYGGAMARDYLRTFQPEEWTTHKNRADTYNHTFGAEGDPKRPASMDNSQKQWKELWTMADRFMERSSKFVLVAGGLGKLPGLASLGFLPWSVILDFDPESDSSGLYHAAAQILEKVRSLVHFGRELQPATYDRGTAWMMASGWPSRSEPAPSSIRDWRWAYDSSIRKLLEELRRSAAPEPIRVFVLPGANLTGEKLNHVLELIDGALQENGEIFLLGREEITDTSMIKVRAEISSEEFVEMVSDLYGTQQATGVPNLPGSNGPVPVPLETLRHLEEDFEVLHSKILDFAAEKSNTQEEFWRGNPPTWMDLHVGVDLPREIHDQLAKKVGDALRENANRVIELLHTPGAGGTTAALRVAWTFRDVYPTIVLQRFSKMTLERIDRIFQMTQTPVLVVADSSVLTIAARDDLRRNFIARNSRAVILHVIRTNFPDRNHPFGLYDPMSRGEAQKFCTAYSKQTNDPAKRSQLVSIFSSPEPYWDVYRSPFFFGLITYEREFKSIERYVSVHLDGISYGTEKIMRYLALVSRYTQCGLDVTLLNLLLGKKAHSLVAIDEAVGALPAKLILKQNRLLRLMHPVLAEEVLRQLLGRNLPEKWSDGLKDLALDCIRDLVRLVGDDTQVVHELFFQLFIYRDYWHGATTPARRFSELIQQIPSPAGQHQLLEELTKSLPDEAHFWNHRGRHHIHELKQDFRTAEEYLKKAVELSGKQDPLHYHSLGMVYRLWIDDRIRKLITEGPPSTPEKILDEVGDLAQKAFQCFSATRTLAQDDFHGYITHIQIVLLIAENLMKAANVQTIGEMSNRKVVAEWLQQNLSVAEDLLERIRHMRADSPPDRYEINCESDLTKMYGNFDDAIGVWETMLQSVGSQGFLRRALASAYYARGQRRWHSLKTGDLKKICSFMEANLRDEPSNEHDLRMWFQAYKRLHEFTYLQAFDRLTTWASRGNSLDAHFYLYVLQFLLTRSQEDRKGSASSILEHVDRCRELVRGRRDWSYEWLGTKPEWCPLVNFTELNLWRPRAGLSAMNPQLELVTGSIEEIKEPQSGHIRLGQGLKAFFVPGREFWEAGDINVQIHFHLGFSYDGFRAFPVGRGPAPTRSTASSTEIEGVIVDPDLGQRVQAFVLKEIRFRESRGQTLWLKELDKRLRVEFSGGLIWERLGFSSLTAYLSSTSQFRVSWRAGQEIVERSRAARE